MLRNAWPGLDALAMLNNNVLPLWMLMLGLALWRYRPSPPAELPTIPTETHPMLHP